MIRLYLDEDSMSRQLIQALEARDIDVTTSAKQGLRGRGDEEQLALATTLGRTICSKNVGDFSRIHARWLAAKRRHSGIILVNRSQSDIGEQLRALLRICADRTAEEMRDRLEFLSNWR